MSALPPITPGPAAASRRTNPPIPWGAPVVRMAEPVATVTISRRFLTGLCSVAIGATAALAFTLGAVGASNAPARANGTDTVTVTAARGPVAAMAGRGPNAEERARLNAAQSASTAPCWAEWNDIQNGFEIICDPTPTGSAAPTR